MKADRAGAIGTVAGLVLALAGGMAPASTLAPDGGRMMVAGAVPGHPLLIVDRTPVRRGYGPADRRAAAEVAIPLGVSVCRHAAAGVTPACALMMPAALAANAGARDFPPRPTLLARADAGTDTAFWPDPLGSGRRGGGPDGHTALPWAAPSAVSGGTGGRHRSDPAADGSGESGDGGTGGEDIGGGTGVRPDDPLPVPLMPSAAFLLAAMAGFGAVSRRRS
ncbi:hypothetical protein BV509_12100 [Rhodovulum sulfidophilum]|uniref:Secreted protein n=1 Tax=Rhodovulum visakhapatnamense TaxID=364297 RepID=A0ABS1RHB4_9RHOB|nr:hypothetical protein [Rhodovulum visakhapatnamense]MBL3570226.1 hypothetical protein [Rhodovulum visakhapatnamense]MBL3578983.1 hypothetical protein [Rhodovulum visakhapatnamense]OLS45007.1 hypothetical protein BV509_12100 [Rhodovulum sulfidophilum]